MLKLLPIGAVLATLISTQLPSLTSTQRLQLAQSPLSTEPYSSTEDNDSSVKLITTALVAGGIAAGGYLATKQANRAKFQTDTSIDRASPKLQKKLLILLHNDRTTANRLLAHIQQINPQKSVNWAMEKVIYDLERDRA